jgi:acyl-ACP thioesterase
MSYIHKESFSIRTSEINHLRKVHPHALIQIMQEASMQHTIGMKVSVWDLESMQGAWVLIKMEVNFFNYPALNDTIKVHTYPSGKEGYFTFRDYLVYDEEDILIATASSQWTMMHTGSRKMMKIPDSFGELIYQYDKPLSKPEFRLKPGENLINSREIKTTYFHLDWNGHVNNVVMIRMILENLDDTIYYQKNLKSLKIQFKSEAVIAQVLCVHFESLDSDNIIRHTVTDKLTGKELVLAETLWENY